MVFIKAFKLQAAIAFFAVLMICLPLRAQEPPLKLLVPNFNPYTFLNKGVVQGVGVDLVSRVMSELGVSYELSLVPSYGRALMETQQGRADGFFLASENLERNEFAVFSAPLMNNNWAWYVNAKSQLDPKNHADKQAIKVGTVSHTNTHKWLVQSGYPIAFDTSKAELLPKMLYSDKIDAVFLAEIVFDKYIAQSGINKSQFKKIIEVSKPFGIYISKEYINSHPEFMGRLNAAIKRVSNAE